MALKAALCQTDIVWGDKRANIESASRMINNADADIVILPEMFSTGFEMEPHKVAETMDGKTTGWIRNIASQSGKAVICSVVINDPGNDRDRFYNRLIFAEPNGKIHKYDKRHLFSFSGEDRNYTAGAERVIVEYKGFRILPLVCYDLRFPVWSRGSDEFDIIIYIASWPSTRITVWDTLLRARAIENQSYAIGVNRVGNDPVSHYPGHSAAVDYYGNVMAVAADDSVRTITAEFDIEPLRAFREKFPAWRDSDRFEIII